MNLSFTGVVVVLLPFALFWALYRALLRALGEIPEPTDTPERVQVYFGSGATGKRVQECVKLCPSLAPDLHPHFGQQKAGYRPHGLAHLGGIIHSIAGTMTPALPRGVSSTKAAQAETPWTKRREIFITPDGGTLSLDYFDVGNAKLGPKSPVVMLLPGFEGGSDSIYLRRLLWSAARCRETEALCLHHRHHQRKLHADDLRYVVLNFRGYADMPVTSPYYHNLASTDDLALAVSRVQASYPQARLLAAGFSMGSNNLCRYLSHLAERGLPSPFVAAASIGNPFDLQSLKKANEERGWNSRLFYEFYHRLALRKLKQKVLRYPIFGQKCDLKQVAASKTLEEFSASFSAKLYGFATAEEYYFQASCANFVDRTAACPLLCLSSLDDPLVPSSAIPRRLLAKNPHAVLAVTTLGGHLAYIDERNINWMDSVVLQWLLAGLSTAK